jgi:hypothetical protein
MGQYWFDTGFISAALVVVNGSKFCWAGIRECSLMMFVGGDLIEPGGVNGT